MTLWRRRAFWVPNMNTVATLFKNLRPRERRGSRARCVLLTQGSNKVVAHRLSALAAPFATVDPVRHSWMPRGFAEPREARLDDLPSFLSERDREVITNWFLRFPRGANTPNWDIASTATVDGREGLLLVEAKAHTRELSDSGKARLPARCRRKDRREKREKQGEDRGGMRGSEPCAQLRSAGVELVDRTSLPTEQPVCLGLEIGLARHSRGPRLLRLPGSRRNAGPGHALRRRPALAKLPEGSRQRRRPGQSLGRANLH